VKAIDRDVFQEVRWLGGGVEVLEDIPVDRLLTIAEGRPPATPQPSPTSSLVK